MFTLTIIIGLYAYTIFFLGVAGLLYLKFVLPITIFFILCSFFIIKPTLRIRKLSEAEFFLLFLLFFQILINLIGALGPELSFDALWYHLTLPKLYVQNHAIIHFFGWLLNYSAMPKLTEMLYTVALLFSNEIFAKCIHFLFGILVLGVIYKIARKYYDSKYSVLACIVFYSNLVVGWMSIAAYIDLARTFYELMTFWAFILFTQKKENKYLALSAIFMGLTISTKLLSVGSFIIYIPLLFWLFGIRKNIKKTVTYIAAFIVISLLVPLPWFIFSFIHTGNPVYPIFSGLSFDYHPLTLLNPFHFLRETWIVLTHTADPISPIYIIFLPLIILCIKKLKKHEKIFVMYLLLGFLAWYITPRTGGGRFILPYLPVASILVIIVLTKLSGWIKKYSIILIILISLISIGYRGIANKKYLSVILGKQTKADFLAKNLNFNFGDFYDVDGYFLRTIKPTDRVLIYGIHNLFYVNFPFIHESYLKKGDWFNYILIGNDPPAGGLPQKYSNWKLIYQNNINKVNLYKVIIL